MTPPPETEVACTSCGSQPEQLCRTRDGRELRYLVHNPRIRAWIAAVDTDRRRALLWREAGR